MSERHSKYLDNVKHPAKKMRTTDDVNELFIFENE